MQEITLPEELTAGEGYGKVSWAIKTFWESYIGWFQLQSTTELYAKNQNTNNRDLLELLDSNALLNKAEKLIGNNEENNIRALHLLDIALSDEDTSSKAIELAIQAHEHLLSDAQKNFWLKGWLAQQITLLKARL
jgi:alkyl sulfatase BDS1-like metallo-beta-lactamase superfamily hydrolase